MHLKNYKISTYTILVWIGSSPHLHSTSGYTSKDWSGKYKGNIFNMHTWIPHSKVILAHSVPHFVFAHLFNKGWYILHLNTSLTYDAKCFTFWQLGTVYYYVNCTRISGRLFVIAQISKTLKCDLCIEPITSSTRSDGNLQCSAWGWLSVSCWGLWQRNRQEHVASRHVLWCWRKPMWTLGEHTV